MIETSSGAAEIDKPLRPQSKAPDAFSRIRECVCDCKCNAIEFNQTYHIMNALCNQRSGCLPPVSKSCVCCSETQKTCHKSCHWVAKTQWWLAWEGRKLRFSKWIQQHRQGHWLLPLEWGLWEIIYRVEVLSLLSDKKQDCFHVEVCTVAVLLGRSKCFPTLTFHTSWSTLENSHSRDRRKALWRNNMISRVRNHDYKESWRFEQQNT